MSESREAPERILIQERADNSWPDGDWINPIRYDRPKDLGYVVEYIRADIFHATSDQHLDRIAELETQAACNYEHRPHGFCSKCGWFGQPKEEG